MAAALPVRAALTRGALVTLANWPVVLIDFVVESLYKFALAVPVVAGVFMAALLLGADVRSLLAGGVLSATDQILGQFGQVPLALVAFTAAVGVVALGGEVLMFIAKAGTLSILVVGERTATDFQRPPVRWGMIRTGATYSLADALTAVRRFQGRAAALGLWLGGVYAFVVAAYLGTVIYGFQWVVASPYGGVWPLLVLFATSTGMVTLTGANLVFDLLRVVIIHDDTTLREAWRRVRHFLVADARQVLGIFGTMAVVVMIATAISLSATAGLALVAWAPVVGLLVLPLQAAFWIVRGVCFEYAALTTLTAYQCQYRRYSRPEALADIVQVEGR